MTARPYLNQGDPDFNRPGMFVGRSRKKIKDVGCTITAVAQAVRKLGVDGAATPLSVQARALAAWDGVEGSGTCVYAAGSAAAYVGRLGNGNGIVVHDKVNRVEAHMGDTLVDNVKGGIPVLLLIDKDGDPDVEHWCCALALDAGHVVYADPDGGLEGRLPVGSQSQPAHLEGYSPSGKHRYRVLGIRVVTREA